MDYQYQLYRYYFDLESVQIFGDRIPCSLKNAKNNTHTSTVFENHRKSLIQHCERSELRLHFEGAKVHFGEFLKTWSLRSNSVTRQVSFDRTKIGGKCQNGKNSNATFWVIFKQCDFWSDWPASIKTDVVLEISKSVRKH